MGRDESLLSYFLRLLLSMAFNFTIGITFSHIQVDKYKYILLPRHARSGGYIHVVAVLCTSGVSSQCAEWALFLFRCIFGFDIICSILDFPFLRSRSWVYICHCKEFCCSNENSIG